MAVQRKSTAPDPSLRVGVIPQLFNRIAELEQQVGTMQTNFSNFQKDHEILAGRLNDVIAEFPDNTF